MIISSNAGIYVFHVTNPTLRVIGIVIMVLAFFQTHKVQLPRIFLYTSTIKILFCFNDKSFSSKLPFLKVSIIGKKVRQIQKFHF